VIDVAIGTFDGLPALYEDEQLLVTALEARNLRVRSVVWDDPSIDWAEARMCLLRSVWDYHLRHPEFLAWLDSLPPSMQVWNPPDVVRWNSHKRYLRDLESRGIPIVPTEWFAPEEEPDLARLAGSNGWDAVVVKPVVSADAYRTSVFDGASFEVGQKHLDALLADGEAMVQRFMDEVHDAGERCLIVIDGEITHAVRKTTVFDPAWEDRPPRVEVSDAERALAQSALDAAGFEYLYARVDMVHDDDGAPRLMELEMFEPTLYFGEGPGSADLLAERVASLLS
jgi:glutathione synthase/RimK-type ligase-like ATP-grasp enzyme